MSCQCGRCGAMRHVLYLAPPVLDRTHHTGTASPRSDDRANSYSRYLGHAVPVLLRKKFNRPADIPADFPDIARCSRRRQIFSTSPDFADIANLPDIARFSRRRQFLATSADFPDVGRFWRRRQIFPTSPDFGDVGKFWPKSGDVGNIWRRRENLPVDPPVD